VDPQADAAQLLYDADGKRIAIRPCKKTEPHAYALQRTKAGGQVNAKSFLTHHGQMRKASTHFEPEWNGELKSIVFSVA
jgi:hypothetical protein